jgi:hypothetical protein
MATGSGFYDANGVWQYGENDSISLFSDTLNIGQASVSNAFTDDRSRLSTIEESLDSIVTFVASSSSARDIYWGVPSTLTQRLALQNSGATTIRTDTGWSEKYYATYDASTNPGGATPAGWYPVEGILPHGIAKKNATVLSITGGSYQNVSVTNRWDIISVSQGMPTYIGGWTIPITGIWEVTTNMAGLTSPTFGFRINNSTPPGSWVGLNNPQLSITGGTTGLFKLNANDTLTIHALVATTQNWPNEPATDPGTFAVRYLYPAK